MIISLKNKDGLTLHTENKYCLENIIIDINEENLKAENIKEGISILGIEGTLSGGAWGAKVFNTLDELNQDNTAKEGDIAVVYREDIQNYNSSLPITKLIFPKTVILPEAKTGYCYGYGSGNIWLDFDGNVTSTEAHFNIMGELNRSITYTSTDGLTYTRTGDNDETIIISEEPITLRMSEWDDVCGYFINIPGHVFEGLYQYVPDHSKSYYVTSKGNKYAIILPKGIIYSNKEGNSGGSGANWDASSGYFYLSDFVVENGKIQSANMYGANGTSGNAYINGDYLACSSSYSEIYITPIAFNWDKGIVYFNGDKQTINSVGMLTLLPKDQEYINLYDVYSDNTYTTITISSSKVNYDKVYTIAPSQLTLSTSNEILSDKIGYGNNGVITGTLNANKNVDPKDVLLKTQVWNNLSSLSIKGTNCFEMFMEYKGNSLPSLTFEDQVETFSWAFGHCYNLTNVPNLPTSNCTNFSGMYSYCSNLLELPNIDTSKGKNFDQMLGGCANLTAIPAFNLSEATNISRLCYSCRNLVDFPYMTIPKVTGMTDIFSGCTNLSEASLNNILGMCASAEAYLAQGTQLTLYRIGLTSSQAQVCKNLSNYSAFVNAGWADGWT